MSIHHLIPRTLVSALTALTLATATPGQHQLFQFDGVDSGESFGSSCASAGDVDRDGFVDVIVGAYLNSKKAVKAGAARVISGKDGSVILEEFGLYALGYFGRAVCGPGDLDGDGYADVVIGGGYRFSRGEVRVISGRTRAVMKTFRGPHDYSYFGMYSIAPVGDIDRDGRPDFVIGASGATPAGTATVVSGKTLSILKVFVGQASKDEFGGSVSGGGDINGDGWPDVIVGAQYADANGSNSGCAYVFSGKDWSMLWRWPGDAARDQLGCSVAHAGDIDKDGRADVVVGAKYSQVNFGRVKVMSGRTGGVLKTFDGKLGWFLGGRVDGGGDVNADGYPDIVFSWPERHVVVYSGKDWSELLHFTKTGIAFGASYAFAQDMNRDGHDELLVGATSAIASGSLFVYSGQKLSSSANTHVLSLTTGGSQRIALDAEPKNSGNVYLILGSTSGVTPGIKLAGVTLPLNVDAYFNFTATSPNSLISTSLGILDAQGRANASFDLPTGLPVSLAGTVLHHAYVVMKVPLTFEFASNAVPLRLTQ